jgi:phage-related tail protein
MKGFFSGITSAFHTFAAWAEKELGLLNKAMPSLEQTAASILKYAGPALQMVITAEAGAPAGAIVGKVLADAQAALTAAAGFIYDYGATPTAATITQSAVTNLSSLLAAGHITNSTSVATVTTVINNLNNLTQALYGNTAPATTSASPAPIPVSILQPVSTTATATTGATS